MILIPCPFCGPRAQTEFSYGGDASVARPEYLPESDAVEGTDTDQLRHWLDHIYLRDNPRGPHLEWWHHHSGCRAWIKVRRDTATHDVLGSWQATEDVPPLACSDVQSAEDGG